jgi:hypothetical protein
MRILSDYESTFHSLRAGLFVVLLFCSFAACGGKPAGSGNHSPEMEALAASYKAKIELTNLGLSRGENYLGDAVYYVQGKARNLGDRPVQQLELLFKLRDVQNRILSEEIRMALNYKGGGSLAPQATSEFTVGFEKLPVNWNYALPGVSVNKVVFR